MVSSVTVKLSNFNAYSEFTSIRNSLRFDWVRKVRQIELLIFFFMIRLGRIELAIYSNKELDSIELMQKRLLTRVWFGRTES